MNPDATITFRLPAPDAVAVQIRFANGFEGARLTPLARGADGVWSATLGPFAPDLYEYSLLVDGVAVADPGTALPKPQRAVSTSLVAVPGNPLVDDRDIPHCTIHEELVNSRVMKAPRPLLVYTPPGYARLDDLPVLVLYHGAGDTTRSWVRQGRVAQMMDSVLSPAYVGPLPPLDAARVDAAYARFDVVTGSNDFILFLQDLLAQALTDAGARHTYTKVPGGDHSMFVWRPALRDFVRALTADHRAGRWCDGHRRER